MAEVFYNGYAKCEINYDRAKAYTCGANKNMLCPNYFKVPIVDDRYFDSHSVYEKCKCINKIKSSLEILVKSEPEKYNAYLEIYNKKYTQNKCEEVFKNFIETNARDIYNSATQQDKIRIEAQIEKERKQRLYIGFAVIIVSIAVIGIFSFRNK
jgi:hypothetical protein